MLSVKEGNHYRWISDHDLFFQRDPLVLEPCRFHDIYNSSHTSLEAWNKCQVCFWSDRSFKDLLNGVQCCQWALWSLQRQSLQLLPAPTSAGCAVAFSVRPMGFVAASFPCLCPQAERMHLLSSITWNLTFPCLPPQQKSRFLYWLSVMQGAKSKLAWGTELKDRTLQKNAAKLLICAFSALEMTTSSREVVGNLSVLKNFKRPPNFLCGMSTQPCREGV